MRFETLLNAHLLPPDWDDRAELIFQKRAFLEHAEAFNLCSQRYYLAWEGDELVAGAVVYTLTVSIFTFSRINSPVRMTVIGLPASVSAPGVFGKSDEQQIQLVTEILQLEHGLILGLNFHPELRFGKAVHMNMLPSVGIDLGFEDFSEYKARLRAPYRRRVNRILEKFGAVKQVESSCGAYTDEHHQLYLQILKKTPSKLEVLKREFFANLPGEFTLTSYYHEDSLLCWHITASDNGTLFFFFGGHDYNRLQEFHSYFNNLFGILREGIQGRYTMIEFGQTAEIAKMKVGGYPIPKAMFIYFRNPVLNSLLRVFQPLITYRAPLPAFNAFRVGEPEKMTL